jgi:hypothetical protein
MKKIFFGGSREIRHLNQSVKQRIDNIIAYNYRILIGDANGADKTIQSYLSEKDYKNVLIYCMGDTFRNNIGKWNTKNVHSNSNQKNFNYYSIKDQMMSDEADYGFMLWDAKSKGTLNNILNLIDRNKKVLVYFSPTKSFYTVKNKNDVSKLLEKCDTESLKKFDKIPKISKRIKLKQQELKLV